MISEIFHTCVPAASAVWTKNIFLRWLVLILFFSASACNGQKMQIRKETNSGLTSIKGIVTEIVQIGKENYLATIETGRPNPTIAVIVSTDLQYPESFTIFKKGEEVCVSGIWINNDQMNVRRFSIIQSEENFQKIITAPIPKDSLKLENIIEFSTYEDDSTPQTPSVRFVLRITNLSNRFIPALSSINNGLYINDKKTNGVEQVTEFYKNGESRGHAIYNGLGYENETINKGGVSETAEGSLLTKDAGIRMNGDTITIQWKYMGVLSEKITVDLKNKKILK